MNEEKKRILDMLAEGKLTPDEAALLLDQLTETPQTPEAEIAAPQGKKMLRVRVLSVSPNRPKPTQVNLNLPLKVARIAAKIVRMAMPQEARDALEREGVSIDPQELEALIDALSETGGDLANITHDEDGEHTTVHIYIE
ncbi:MAG: hypothetical protein LBM74_03595 [Oscillospiraceae bacterium]|jgi:hypothetical protein|nr:hypothetical protein [Oscillospiraceae bacterium]